MANQAHIDLWIAQGADAENARMLAAMYGAPKKADAFLSRWNIHANDWNKVACKARVKKVVTAFEKAGLPIARLYLSPAFGSAYIEIGTVQEDGEWLETLTVRVSDHARTSSEHAQPDFNVVDAASLDLAIKALAA